jgi:prevent-host-death family protein
MVLKYGAREARSKFAEVLGRVGYGGEVVIVERSGKPVAVVVPVDMYATLVGERKARFQVLDRIRERAPALSDEEIEKDVSEAIQSVRAADAAGGS